MKKIILISIIALSFNACKKCAMCTTETVTHINVYTPGYPKTQETTYEACGDQLKEISGKSTEMSHMEGNRKITVLSKTTCR